MLLIINYCFTLLRIWFLSRLTARTIISYLAMVRTIFSLCSRKWLRWRFTNKKGNNRLPYLSFPYPISPNNPYTL